MKKIALVLTASLLLAVAIFYKFKYQPASQGGDESYQVMMENEAEIEFTGLIMAGGRDSCPVDGTCSVIVSGKEVILGQGWTQEPRGFVETGLKEDVKVEVYAKKIDDRTVTIYGNDNYYLRLVGDGLEN